MTFSSVKGEFVEACHRVEMLALISITGHGVMCIIGGAVACIENINNDLLDRQSMNILANCIP